jgi:hypothetical protein
MLRFAIGLLFAHVAVVRAAAPTPVAPLAPVLDAALAGGDPITSAAGSERIVFVVDTGTADQIGELVDVFLAHDMTATLFVAHADDEPLREQLARAAAQGFTIGLAADRHASAAQVDAALHALATAVDAPIGVIAIAGATTGRNGLTLVRATLGVSANRLVTRLVADHGGLVHVSADAARPLAAMLVAIEKHDCATTAPLLPASLHVLVRDHHTPRKPPAAATDAIAAYREFLPALCRGPQPAPQPWQLTRGRIRQECLDNPLAPGCGQ